MKKIVYMKISKGDTHFVAEGVDFPVVTQGETMDELTRNIREAVALLLEDQDVEIVHV